MQHIEKVMDTEWMIQKQEMETVKIEQMESANSQNLRVPQQTG